MGNVDAKTFFKLSYGLFLLSANENGKDNGCIINTAVQVADSPKTISIAINKQNYTHDMVLKTGVFNISILTEKTPFSTFERFGFSSGKDTDKFGDYPSKVRSENGVYYITDYANAVMSGKVVSTLDLGSHTLFIAEVTEAKVLSDEQSITYAYYHANTKPKPQPKASESKVWVCNICGYTYDEAKTGKPFEELPSDWTCPWCKHPKSDFILQK